MFTINAFSPLLFQKTVYTTAEDVLNAGCYEKVRVTLPINKTNAIDLINVGDILQLHDDGHIENRKDPQTGNAIQVVVFKRFEGRRVPSSQTTIVHIPLLARCDFVCMQSAWSTLQEYTSSDDVTFPLTNVRFCDTCTAETHSMDHVILQEESPMTILGVISYYVTHMSLHLNDPFFPSFQASQTIPDYYDFNITPASQIPIDPVYLDVANFQKPPSTIQVLTATQFIDLRQRLDEENMRLRQSLQPEADVDDVTPSYMNIQIPFQDPINVPGEKETTDAITAANEASTKPANEMVPTLERHLFAGSPNTNQLYVIPSSEPSEPVQMTHLGYVNIPKEQSFEDMGDVFDVPPPMPVKMRSYSSPDVLESKSPIPKADEHKHNRGRSADAQSFSTHMIQSFPPSRSVPDVNVASATRPAHKPKQLPSPNKPKPPKTAMKPQNRKPPPPVAAKPAGKPASKSTDKPTVQSPRGGQLSPNPTGNVPSNVFDLKKQISIQLKAGKDKRVSRELETNNNEPQVGSAAYNTRPVAQPRNALSPPSRPLPGRTPPGNPVGGVSILPGVRSNEHRPSQDSGNAQIRPKRMAPSRPLPQPGSQSVTNNIDDDSSDDG